MSDGKQCGYCETQCQAGESLVTQLAEAHDREELSRVDRRRVETHTAEGSSWAVERDRLALGVVVLVGLGLVSAIAIGGLVSAQSNPYAGGSGTAGNPYQIADWTHLNDTRKNLDANFTLVNDLDETTAGYDNVANLTANGGDGFLPIGNLTHRFNGTFDGAGYAISGLHIYRSSENRVGLFGVIDGTVTNVSLDVVNVIGNDTVGGLVGQNFRAGPNGGTINDSSATGNVIGTETVGGLVGHNNGTVTESFATEDNVTGNKNVGGLVGHNDGTVTESFAAVRVSASARLGGLVGWNDDGDVFDSYATGNVSGGDSVGGLVGISGVGKSNVTRTYAAGNVSGGANVGGLVGLVSNAGFGFVGNSYWDTLVTGQSNAVGSSNGGFQTNLVGLTTSQMQGSAATGNMTALDFSTTWTTVAGGFPINPVPQEDSYPILTEPDVEQQLDALGVPFLEQGTGVEIDADNVTFENVTIANGG